jgi:ATP-dependent DNA ligase
MDPIIPIVRKEPFDDPAWLFDLKLDGFRGIADTVERRMLSKNGYRLTRALPVGYVFDGEIVRERRALLAKIVRRYGLQRCEPVLGEGKAAFNAVRDLDLEGIIAKKLDDPMTPSGPSGGKF